MKKSLLITLMLFGAGQISAASEPVLISNPFCCTVVAGAVGRVTGVSYAPFGNCSLATYYSLLNQAKNLDIGIEFPHGLNCPIPSQN